jgi:beta-glucosidase
MVMPDEGLWKSGALVTGVKNGSLSQARLDDMATRILASWYKLGMDSPSYPALGLGMTQTLTRSHQRVEGRDPASRSTLFQSAVEGHVLVKNVNNTLPLNSPQFLSLFGFDAYAPLLNNPTSLFISRWGMGFDSVGLSDASLLGILAGNIVQAPGTATTGTLTFGGGSGSSTGSYFSAPYNALEQQAYEDGTYLLWDFKSQTPDVNPASNACIVFINEFSTEAADRPSLADPDADKLVTNVASKCRNTIVVIHNAGIRLVDNWIDNANVTAVILAHLPGQDSGRALVEVMYGKQSPSGRLPYTVAKKESDYGDLLAPSQPGPLLSNTSWYPQSDFKEGLYIGYRDFIARNVTPRYAFGYGLTYTTFEYSSLSFNLVPDGIAKANLQYLVPEAPAMVQGGNPLLYEKIALVDFRVSNTGSFAASEVAQLYIGIPNSPPRQLRGFTKKFLAPGQTENFHFDLTRRDLSIWSTHEQNWVLQKGNYPIYVGASVLDIKLQGFLSI